MISRPTSGKFSAWWWFLAVLVPIMLLLKLPSLVSQQHLDSDEQIYLALSDNLYHNGRYSLQGTPLLRQLSPGIYDKPLFHHPPLYPMLIGPLSVKYSPSAAVILSWLGHVLVVLAVFIILRRVLGPDRQAVIVLVAALAAFDPLMFFTSQKIWLDSLLAGLAGMSVALFLLATEAERPAGKGWWSAAAGAAFGLAVLVKLPAAMTALVMPALYLRKHGTNDRRHLIRYLIAFSLPALVLTAPWFIKFYSVYHVLIPGWVAPDAWLIRNNPFIRMVMDRPIYYFFKEFFLLAPVMLLSFVCLALSFRPPTPLEFVMGGWMLYVLLFLTCLAAFSGYTYQMRLITMACAPAYVFLGLSLDRANVFGRPTLYLLCLVGLAVNAMTCLLWGLLNYQAADVLSLVEPLVRIS